MAGATARTPPEVGVLANSVVKEQRIVRFENSCSGDSFDIVETEAMLAGKFGAPVKTMGRVRLIQGFTSALSVVLLVTRQGEHRKKNRHYVIPNVSPWF